MGNHKFRAQAKRFMAYRKAVGDPVKETAETYEFVKQVEKRASAPHTVFSKFGVISHMIIPFVKREKVKT